MPAHVFRLNTANTTNLKKVSDYNATVKGLAAVNTAAYAIFLKLYWYWPQQDGSHDTPTVGTTVPNVTIELPALGTTTGGLLQSWPDGFNAGAGVGGALWVAVTKLAADSDATVVLAGDGLISLFID